ncbi:MAG TPA: Gfo/Idh/MocA family oxidoreductase [Gemmatimonadaceae bacterium]|nr:Gfo/Idh/MocA family oxidoreductase [Gemmatimonadaceae bacterium]
MKRPPIDRRDFLKQASVTGLGSLAAMAASRTGPLIALRGSANDRMVVAVMGLNGRGMVHARFFSRNPLTAVGYVCDVDSNVLPKAVAATIETGGQEKPAKYVTDFRRVLDDKSVDALVIAAPDHWHAPATILALDAGKHVFVEKPSGHNPREDELIVDAARKHGNLRVQLGTQARSTPHIIEVVQAIHAGTIGKAYLARAWYANTRGSIGKGKPAAVPANLDYELWQGPAPRMPYRDNVIHYNWHWFRNWGTGEICNNGTHEIDVARWALGVDYPTSVVSTGGRYHFADDWEFPDTQETMFEFADGKRIIYQGQSCNGLALFDRGRGTLVLGTEGSALIDRDGYIVYDVKGKAVKEVKGAEKVDSLDTRGEDWLTQLHVDNFAHAVVHGAKLSAPIEDGAKTGMLTHLGTIAQQVGRKLTTDPSNGHIVGDAQASSMWTREYDPRWKPVV